MGKHSIFGIGKRKLFRIAIWLSIPVTFYLLLWSSKMASMGGPDQYIYETYGVYLANISLALLLGVVVEYAMNKAGY